MVMFQAMIQTLRKLDGKTIEIYAKGYYPNRRKHAVRISSKSSALADSFSMRAAKGKTAVQAVAHYQNDGTPTITPAKFVERAERKNGGWKTILNAAIEKTLFGATKTSPFTGETVSIQSAFSTIELKRVGQKIADDIGRECDRIKTGRLKRSFTARVK